MLHTYIINYWRDIVEICFFSSIFYYITIWLKKNTYQNLLAYFYSFILLIFCSYILNLNNIVYIVACAWPILCMLFILFHQKTLQHNFIALKQKSDIQLAPTDWLEIVVIHALQAINNNKPIYCIIEATDSMQEFIATSIPLNAPISQELFNLIETSSIFDYQNMLYLQKTGFIKSVNAQWSMPQLSKTADISQQLLSKSPFSTAGYSEKQITESVKWEYETMLRIQHTDAIAFFGNQITHSFTLLTNYDRIPHLSAQHLLDRIKLMYAKKQTSYTQEPKHETTHKKPTHQQRTP